MSLASLRRILEKRDKTKVDKKSKTTTPTVGNFPAHEEPERNFSRATVLVRNSYSTLYEIPEAALERVREILTYKNEAVEKERVQAFRVLAIAKAKGQKKLIYKILHKLEELDGQEYVCWLKGRSFPTGLLHIVQDVLKEAGVEVDVDDERRVPKRVYDFKWNIQPPEPRYYQNEMVELGVKYGRGVFESAVGTGKTMVMKLLIQKFGVTTLIILPSVALVEQTMRGFSESFGRKKITVVSTKTIKDGKKLAPIRLTTVQTLASLQKQGLLQELVRDVDSVAVDEIHHSGSKSYTDLLHDLDHVYYRFGYTGTFLRNDCKTLDMWGFLSNRLYCYPAWKATQEGFLTPVEFVIHTLEGKRHHKYQKEYQLNYCGSEEILEKIEEIVRNSSDNKQMLILVDRKDTAGLVIHEYLLKRGIENTYISGDDKKGHVADCIQAFNRKEIRVMIGSTVIGEGVDVYATDELILARGGKSEIAIVQAIGRAIRLAEGKFKAVVHDFRFDGTKFLTKHLDQRVGIYDNSFQGKIIDEFTFGG